MEFLGGVLGITIAWWAIALTVATLLFPIFWIWMLVDSVMRNDYEYPGASANEKLVWVLLIALVQFAAVFYYFMVYRVVRRGSIAPPAVNAPAAAATTATCC